MFQSLCVGCGDGGTPNFRRSAILPREGVEIVRGIPFRRGVYLMVGVMLVLAMSACSSSDSEEIYGVWITGGPEGVHMTFNEDGCVHSVRVARRAQASVRVDRCAWD
jgi:hypothetical protein